MIKFSKFLFILAILTLPVNFVLAQEADPAVNLPIQWADSSAVEPTPTPVVEPVSTEPIVTNTVSYNYTAAEISKGIKVKVFDSKFVFQVDDKMINSVSTLVIKEMILPPGSNMAPVNGIQLGSRVYEYDFKTAVPQDLAKAFWFSIKYDSLDYYRKNIYFFDQNKNEWVGVDGIIKNGMQKIVGNVSLPYARVAILEDIDIMTEGTASWYKYKGCNCAASPDFPKGTKIKVTNTENDKSVIVKVNDWGPDRSIHPDRVIDLDAVAFSQIAKKSAGLCKVKIEVVQEVLASNK